MTVRLALWSGPRNLSTALMRSFGSRADCAVTDEPFYAAYLAATGLDHPMRAAILAAQPTDAHAVAAALAGAAPSAAPLWYQKHMCHHMLPDFPLDWMAACRHGFLIRRPEAVLVSYASKREHATLADLGFERQADLFDRIADRAGAAPPVVESSDILADPPGMLTALCRALSIEFDPAMLAWPAGPRSSDGVWAPVWYGAVERSTGFAPPRPEASLPDLPPHLAAIADAARPFYERLARYRLPPAPAAGRADW